MIWKISISIIAFSLMTSINPLFAEKPLELMAKEGSHSVGHDQNKLGINAYNKKKFTQALKHFQVASIVYRKKVKFFLI